MVDGQTIPHIIIGLDGMAKLLGVSVPQIYIYLKAGMPGKKIGGKWHFHWNKIDKWFEDECGKMPDLKSEDDWKEI